MYVGVLVASAATGMYPENISPFGEHGASKVDVTTEWFFGANWNCTISPGAALRSSGVNVREPFVPPTLTTWTVTIPEGLVPVDIGAATEETEDCARAPTTLKAERATVVNCILTLKILISK